jgi:hypothetical protein
LFLQFFSLFHVFSEDSILTNVLLVDLMILSIIIVHTLLYLFVGPE